MPTIYKRNCDQCGNYYEGAGIYCCSRSCCDKWKTGRKQKKEPTANRFWSKVQIIDLFECWLWTAYKNKSGYGYFKINNKYKYSHRIAWELVYGPIPNGKYILHHCDNPPCCNPTHLFMGTLQDNTIDMVRKGRNYVSKGEQHPQSKLTEQDVLAIRLLHKQGVKQVDIARKFNIKSPQTSAIILRKWWKHI